MENINQIIQKEKTDKNIMIDYIKCFVASKAKEVCGTSKEFKELERFVASKKEL